MGSRIRVDVTRPLATVLLEPAGAPEDVEDGGWRTLAEAFHALSLRRDVHAVVVRGTLGRAPAARQNDRDAEGTGADRTPLPSEEVDAALAAVRSCRHPTVAVIEGLCVGADLELAACCDLRVCGESSRLGAPIDRGETNGTFMGLSQLLGASPALEALQGGDMLDAERARAYGLVSHVHPDAAVVEHAYRLAAGAPLVNRWHKSVVQRLHDRTTPPVT